MSDMKINTQPSVLFNQELERLGTKNAGGLNVSQVPQANFGQVLQQALSQVSQLQTTASQQAYRFQLGDPNVSLESMMVSSQKASLGFQTLVQARNKLVSAYSEIMNMQV